MRAIEHAKLKTVPAIFHDHASGLSRSKVDDLVVREVSFRSSRADLSFLTFSWVSQPGCRTSLLSGGAGPPSELEQYCSCNKRNFKDQKCTRSTAPNVAYYLVMI